MNRYLDIFTVEFRVGRDWILTGNGGKRRRLSSGYQITTSQG